MTKTTMVSALALVLASGMTAPAHGQDAKAAEILAKTREAIGGRQVEELKALSVQAAMQRNIGDVQMASDVEIHVETPDKYVRREQSRRGMSIEMSNGFNGDRAIVPAGGVAMAGGGMFIRMGGPGGPMAGPERPKPTPEQLEEMNRGMVRNQRAEISRLMLGWLGTAHPSIKAQYTYAGEAESPDGKAHVIDVTGEDGFAARLFIDQNNYLPLMVTYEGRQPRMMTSTMRSPAGPQQDTEERMRRALEEQPLVEFTIFFDDWREVDGIHFPHLMRRGSGGTTTEEWTISRVKVNPKLDAKTFAVEAK